MLLVDVSTDVVVVVVVVDVDVVRASKCIECKRASKVID